MLRISLTLPRLLCYLYSLWVHESNFSLHVCFAFNIYHMSDTFRWVQFKHYPLYGDKGLSVTILVYGWQHDVDVAILTSNGKRSAVPVIGLL